MLVLNQLFMVTTGKTLFVEFDTTTKVKNIQIKVEQLCINSRSRNIFLAVTENVALTLCDNESAAGYQWLCCKCWKWARKTQWATFTWKWASLYPIHSEGQRYYSILKGTGYCCLTYAAIWNTLHEAIHTYVEMECCLNNITVKMNAQLSHDWLIGCFHQNNQLLSFFLLLSIYANIFISTQTWSLLHPRTTCLDMLWKFALNLPVHHTCNSE